MTLPFPSPADAATTLEGVLEKVVFANEENAWSVVRLAVPGHRDLVTAVGHLLGGQPGENLRLTGAWITDPKYGRQFRVSFAHPRTPKTVLGIERFLGSGLIHGIGPSLAKRIVEKFGKDTLDVIDKKPDRLTTSALPVRHGAEPLVQPCGLHDWKRMAVCLQGAPETVV